MTTTATTETVHQPNKPDPDGPFTVLFKDGKMKQSLRLTPTGGLTSRVLFAAMITTREQAEKIAEEIRGDFPDATVTVRKF